MANTSPLPQSVSKSGSNKTILMDFGMMIKAIMDGKHVTKLEWEDNDIYLLLQDGHLRLHKADGKFCNLIVRDGDMLGKDWVVL